MNNGFNFSERFNQVRQGLEAMYEEHEVDQEFVNEVLSQVLFFEQRLSDWNSSVDLSIW